MKYPVLPRVCVCVCFRAHPRKLNCLRNMYSLQKSRRIFTLHGVFWLPLRFWSSEANYSMFIFITHSVTMSKVLVCSTHCDVMLLAANYVRQVRHGKLKMEEYTGVTQFTWIRCRRKRGAKAWWRKCVNNIFERAFTTIEILYAKFQFLANLEAIYFITHRW